MHLGVRATYTRCVGHSRRRATISADSFARSIHRLAPPGTSTRIEYLGAGTIELNHVVPAVGNRETVRNPTIAAAEMNIDGARHCLSGQ